MNFQIIETPRLLLKGLTPEDFKFIFEHYPKQEIMQLLGHRSEEEYQKEEFKVKNGYSTYNRSFVLFFLVDKVSDTIIGRCSIHNWNADHKRGEVGYSMEDEEFKQKGLMTEALGAVIDFGFNTLNLHRIEALVGSENTPSLKLMEKYGFVKEGLLREHYYIDGKYEDSIQFSKLKNEYK